jgi:hypothetical protein
LSSFVILARCGSHEEAKEGISDLNGCFTAALLRVLKDHDRVMDESTTFEKLIELVGQEITAINESQHPEAHGDKKTSRLWFRDD